MKLAMASSKALDRELALGFTQSFVFVKFSEVPYFKNSWLRSLSLSLSP